MKNVLYLTLLLAAFLMIGCRDTGSPISLSGNQEIAVETQELKEAAKNFEEALSLADAVKIKSLILPKYLSRYSSAIDGNNNKLAEFAGVFKNRKLVAIDKIYAVYEVEYNGSKFEISFALDDDGKWKLMNF